MATGLSKAELDQLTSRLEGRISQRLLTAVTKARQGVHLSKLEAAILNRNYAEVSAVIGRERVLNALADAQATAAPLQDIGWAQIPTELPAALRGLVQVELTLGGYATQAPQVLAAMQRADLQRIQGIDQETVAALRQEFDRLLRDGVNPRAGARQLRDILGLNRAQAAAVTAFRRELEAEGRDPDQVQRMVDRAATRKMQARAENIARTETMSALNTGRQAQMVRLVADGVINGTEWEQEWVVADDERLCPQCAPFDGQRAPIDGVFTSQDFTRSKGPPLHPRCRCIVRLVQQGFREGESTPRQIREGKPLGPAPKPKRAGVAVSRRSGSQATDLQETAAERTRRLAFENEVRRARVEYGFGRLLDGSEQRYTTGQPRQIRFTAAELRGLQGAPLFIHNHPGSTPFSDVDLVFALANRIQLMRVVGEKEAGPVSYETDIGSRQGLTPGRLQLEYDRAYQEAFPTYMNKYQALLAEQMSAEKASRIILYDLQHEVWTGLAERLGFRYVRRLDRP